MQQTTVARLEAFLTEHPILVGGGPVPEAEIAEAEQVLGVRFDPDYRWFVHRYGGAMVGSLPVYGLRTAEVMGIGDTVLQAMRHFHDDHYPNIDGWTIVSDDGFGNPIGIAPDGRVLLCDHDSGFEVVQVAPSFERFLLNLLEGNLYSR